MNVMPDDASPRKSGKGPIAIVVCGVIAVLAESLLRMGWLNSLYGRLPADFCQRLDDADLVRSRHVSMDRSLSRRKTLAGTTAPLTHRHQPVLRSIGLSA